MIIKLISDLNKHQIKLSSALRLCKVILSAQPDEDLQLFIKNELEGYEWENTPNYRTLIGTPKANYRRKMDGYVAELPINFSKLNKDIGFDFNERKIITPIPEIESLLAKTNADNKQGEICVTFSSDQLQMLWNNTNASNDNGWIIESAFWTFPTNMFDQIISRTTDLLTEKLILINSSYPHLNKQLEFMSDKKEENKTIQTNIHGNISGSVLGIGEQISQKEISISQDPAIEKIVDKIIELGFDKTDTQELREILIEKNTGKSIGKKLLSWVGKMSNKAVEKGIEHNIPALTEAIGNYF